MPASHHAAHFFTSTTSGTRACRLWVAVQVAWLLSVVVAKVGAAPADWFGIRVVDDATGRGVPLVVLTTTHHLPFVTDSAGWVAFQEPGLMEREVYFHVRSPGYSVAKDGFGYEGVKLRPRAGAKVEVKVKRSIVAERLYRVTGEGIYRDSVLLGEPVPLKNPVFNTITGQDSVQAVPWRGRLFWLWGDTNQAGYPLGNFHSTCAWSDLPGQGGLPASVGVDLDYLKNPLGQARRMVPMEKPGVVWVFGLLAVSDSKGGETLLGHYGRYKSLSEQVEHGLVEWDESLGHLVPRKVLAPDNIWRHPVGNAVRVQVAGADHFYFVDNFAMVRVEARHEAVLDPAAYEALAWDGKSAGYIWQKQAPPASQQDEAKRLQSKAMPPEKARFQVEDAATGAPILVHRSSIAWSPYRQRWIMIASQVKGKESHLGEVWYAEALEITGPWKKAVKVASHPKYTFYNPRQHPYFVNEGGRKIFFEGTYTETFSGNPVATPRYDYNQLMYRLDLDAPALAPARVPGP